MPARRPVEERFWEKVAKGGPDECWLWTAGINNTGYGSIGIDRKSYMAHRLSYQWAHGEIPADRSVCHSCDVRRCVNPKHLWLGSLGDNNADRHAKGRSRGASHPGEGNPMAKLSEATVRAIASMPGTLNAVASMFGVPMQAVSSIRRGRAWGSVTGRSREPFRVDGLAPKQRQVFAYLSSRAVDGIVDIPDAVMARDLGLEDRRLVAWVKQKLARSGHIKKVRRGVWEVIHAKV